MQMSVGWSVCCQDQIFEKNIKIISKFQKISKFSKKIKIFKKFQKFQNFQKKFQKSKFFHFYKCSDRPTRASF